MAKLHGAHAFDADAAKTHLSWLGGDIHLVAIHRSGLASHMRSRYFGDDIDAAVDWAIEQNKDQKGIYVTINRVPVGFSRKPSDADIVSCRFVQIDLDPPKTGGNFAFAATLETLEAIQCPPSFIIGSGGGLQCWWRIEESANIDAIRNINQQVRTFFAADACHDPSRLFRLAGSINYPNAAKEARGRKAAMATIISDDTGQVYEPSDLAAFFPVAEHGGNGARGERHDVAIGNVKLITCDDLHLTQFHPIRRAVERPKGVDRSADAYHAACELVRDGYDDDAIAGMLLNPDNAVSAHVLAQGNPMRAAKRAISQARGDEPDAQIVPDETREAVARLGDMSKKPGKIDTSEECVKVLDISEPAHEPAPWYPLLTPGLRAMVDTIMEYAPSPRMELALGAAITCFATAAGRRYCSPTGVMTNIYCVALMASGAGKDFPLRAVNHVLTHAGAGECAGGKIVSATGIGSALEKSPSLFVPIDEMGKLLTAMANPRGVMREVPAALLSLYSESQGSTSGGMYANTKERETKIVYHPCLTIFGVSTPATFWESLTSAAIVDGFLPRMLLLIDEADEPYPKIDLTRSIWPDSLVKHVATIREAALASGHKVFPMGDGAMTPCRPYTVPYADDSAKQAWFDMRVKEFELRKQSNTMRHAFSNRLAENATKLALIRAIDREPHAPVLTAEDYAFGELLSWRSIVTFDKQIGDNLTDSDYHAKLKRVEAAIARSGNEGTTATQIGRSCQSIPLKERQAIIEDLIDQGRVASEKLAGSGGRPKFIFRIVENNA